MSDQIAEGSGHPHPEDPILDAEGRCLICTRYVFDDERTRIIALCESVGIDALPDSLPSQWGHDTVRRVRELIARLDAAESLARQLTNDLCDTAARLAEAEAVIEAVQDLRLAFAAYDRALSTTPEEPE